MVKISVLMAIQVAVLSQIPTDDAAHVTVVQQRLEAFRQHLLRTKIPITGTRGNEKGEQQMQVSGLMGTSHSR